MQRSRPARLPAPNAMVERMLVAAYVDGENLGFTFVALDGGVRSVRARIDGAVLSGTLHFAGNLTPIAGRRR